MANILDGMTCGKHNSDNTETEVPIKTFTVSVKFTDMVANNVMEAARKACEWLKEDAESLIYEVTNETTLEKYETMLDKFNED